MTSQTMHRLRANEHSIANSIERRRNPVAPPLEQDKEQAGLSRTGETKEVLLRFWIG